MQTRSRLREKKPIGLGDEEFEIYKNMQFLRMWRYPWGLWIMSSICFLSASFLIASMTFLEFIDTSEAGLLQYLSVFAFLTLSCIFFLAAKIEIVSFDKETQQMFKNKWILWFNWKRKIIPFSSIVDISLTLSGRNQKYSDTLYYKISVVTKHTKPISILETKHRGTVIFKALKVRAFFNMKGKILLSDISTD